MGSVRFRNPVLSSLTTCKYIILSRTIAMCIQSIEMPARAKRIASERAGRSCILTVNVGSSSLKFALFAAAVRPARLLSGRIERIGMPASRLVITGAGGASAEDCTVKVPDQTAAVGLLIELLEYLVGLSNIAVVGHRVVHGGSRFYHPTLITPEILEELRKIVAYDPDHLPGEIGAIETFMHLDPNVSHVACFDTAFHHDLPRVAQIIAIPRRYEASGVRRYGFHGLSFAYLMEELGRLASPGAARGRVILAHLGAGASLAAVRDGRCVDTTMGLTPTSGLVMGTRCGDVDPGLVRFLTRAGGLSIDQFHELVNHESGLLGVSETSSDVRDLLARQDTEVRAAEAVELFCYRAKTALGALAAALGGLDTLVFAGGIGENSPEVRRRICDGLEFLGITVDEDRNAASAPLISTEGGRVAVRVIPTDEESMIARRGGIRPSISGSATDGDGVARSRDRQDGEDEAMNESLPRVYLARHGETAWTISRQHTGRTDIPLTERGEANARSLGERLKGETFELVFVSPLGRARRTCELAGLRCPSPSARPTCSSGTTARTRAGPRPKSARSGPGGTCFATAVPGASRSRRSVPGPTASWLASSGHAAASSSSAMATSSASWPRAGWACRRRRRVTSGSAPRRSASSATSTRWTNRPSSSGTTTATPCPLTGRRGQPLPSIAIDDLDPAEGLHPMATRRTAVVETKKTDGPTTGPAFSPNAPRAVRMRSGPVLGDAQRLPTSGALVFDHVVRPEQSDPRQRFEAVAWALRDVLSQRWLKTDATYDRVTPSRSTTCRWSS